MIFDDLYVNHYRALLIDPPWKMAMGTKSRPQHYPRMTDAEIAEMPLADLAHPDGAFMFMWLASPLTERFWVKIWPSWRAQGWRFSARAFAWAKMRRGTEWPINDEGGFHFGAGLTTRKNVEDCLLFKIRKPKRRSGNVRELIVSPVREHSRKPSETYDRIEQFCVGPYAEIFARCNRFGWDTAGNERTKFDEVA